VSFHPRRDGAVQALKTHGKNGWIIHVESTNKRVPPDTDLRPRIVTAYDRPIHVENLFSFSVAGGFVGFEMD